MVAVRLSFCPDCEANSAAMSVMLEGDSAEATAYAEFSFLTCSVRLLYFLSVQVSFL